MQSFDFQVFLDEIKDLNYHEMILVCEARCMHLEKIPTHSKGAVGFRKDESLLLLLLLDHIKGVLFWLKNGRKPSGLSKFDFIRLEPLCRNLIAKKQLKQTALSIFS